MPKELKSIIISKLLALYDFHTTTRFQSVALLFIVGLIGTILISIFTTTSVFSISYLDVNMPNNDLTNQSSLSLPLSASLYSEHILNRFHPKSKRLF